MDLQRDAFHRAVDVLDQLGDPEWRFIALLDRKGVLDKQYTT